MSTNIFGTNPPQATQSPPQQQQMKEIKQLLQTLDPNQTQEQMLQTLVNKNPQFGNLFSLLNGTNGDIRSLVTNLAKLKGVDLNALYEQFKAL